MAGLDQELFTSPLKDGGRQEDSDTDFQTRGVDTDVEASEDAGEVDEKELRDMGGAVSTPVVKGKESFFGLVIKTLASELTRNTARPFKRVEVPSGPAPYTNGMDGANDWAPPHGTLPPARLCPACDEIHPIGYCRLRLAGVEHCGLCGLAHSGHARTCPHLNSEVQVATMLGTLKESTEPQDLIEKATKYLRMIRGDLVHRKRTAAQKRNQPQVAPEQQGHRPAGYPPPPPPPNSQYPPSNGPAPYFPHDMAQGRAHPSTFPRPTFQDHLGNKTLGSRHEERF